MGAGGAWGIVEYPMVQEHPKTTPQTPQRKQAYPRGMGVTWASFQWPDLGQLE